MTPRTTLSAVVLAAAIAVAPIAASSAAAASHLSLTPTQVVQLSPLNAAGNLNTGYTITQSHGHASCEAGSETTGNAYRCFAGNFVYDPCWVEKNKHFVVCMLDPWSFKVVQLKVSKGYENGGRSTKIAKQPWGMQLANGVQCSFLPGATGAVGKKRINYGCAHQKYVLIGNVNKSNSVWTIEKAVPSGGGGKYAKAGKVSLTKAWFGLASRKG